MIRRLLTVVSLAGAIVLALTATQALANRVECGDIITQDTTLDSDLLCSGTALTIVGPQVTLDLGGHLVQGDIRASNAVDGSRVTVQNGTVRGVVSVDEYDSSTISHLTATATTFFADQQYVAVLDSVLGGNPSASGVVARAQNVEIARNIVQGGRTGIAVIHADGSIHDNLLQDNAVQGFSADHSGHLTFANNVVRRNGRGIGVQQAILTATGNRIVDNADFGAGTNQATLNLVDNYIARNGGDGVESSFGGLHANRNSILDNAGSGISVPNGFFEITENSVQRNAADGIRTGNNSHGSATDNTADRNRDDGIDIDAPATFGTITLTGNHTWWNGDFGIEAIPGDTQGGGNWAKHNGNPLQCVPASLCTTKGKPKS